MPEQKDFYTPENVDTEIEELLHASGSPTRDQRLMRDLFFVHRPLDSEDERSLERVLSRLLDDTGHSVQPDSVPLLLERDEHKEEGRFLLMQNTGLTEQNKRGRRAIWQRLGVLAATLVVVVIVGSMLMILNIARQGQIVPTGGVPSLSASKTATAALRPGQIVYQSGAYNQVNDLSWSPDGKRIAGIVIPASTQVPGGGIPTAVQSWDALDHQHVLTYKIPATSLYSLATLAWSADGKRLAVVTQKIYVFDAQTTRLLTTFSPPSGTAYSGDGSSTISATAGPSRSGMSLLSSFLPLSGGGLPTFINASWSPDNQWLAAGYTDYTQSKHFAAIYIWSTKSGALVKTLTESQQNVREIVWSPDGKFLADSFYNRISAGSISELRIWDSTTWKIVKQYNSLQAFSWSPDGKQLALVDSAPLQGKDVRIVDVLSGQTVRQFSQTGYISAVYWSPDGSRIAVQYDGLAGKGNVVIWDAVSGRQLLRFTSIDVKDLAWSPDSKYIACVMEGLSSKILVWVAQ
jgi:WD40 repeat protein